MPMFLCRWPNGDFTIVEADDEDHAIELLDEWENADSAVIIPMVDCMFNFRLNDGGDIELQEIGADTQEFIRETCYPELEKVINDVREKDGDVYTPESIERIRAAVEHERTRQDVVTPEPAETEMGKDLQRGMDMARVTANRAVQREGARILDFIKTDPKKIQQPPSRLRHFVRLPTRVAQERHCQELRLAVGMQVRQMREREVGCRPKLMEGGPPKFEGAGQ